MKNTRKAIRKKQNPKQINSESTKLQISQKKTTEKSNSVQKGQFIASNM